VLTVASTSNVSLRKNNYLSGKKRGKESRTPGGFSNRRASGNKKVRGEEKLLGEL